MHGNLDLILTLTGGLAAALVLGYVTNRVGLSPLVGYLLAGIAVGPATPGFVADKAMAGQLAEVGVILLMFGVGLHLHVEDLLAVRKLAGPGAVLASGAAAATGAAVAWGFGWGGGAAAVYGAAVAVASTVVLTRVLSDNRDLHTPAGHLAIGWLVVEDLLTVVVLVLLPPLLGGGGPGVSVPLELLWAAGKIALLVAVAVFVGGRTVPWLLGVVARSGSRELFTLTVLVVALGIAVGSAELFDVSMALGAFLAGMVVGRSEFSLRAASDALPMRDAFAVLFFVSAGMQFDPGALVADPGPALTTIAVVLSVKPLVAAGFLLFAGRPVKVAIATGFALAQIGEFSFILLDLGKRLDVLPASAANAVVAAAIVTISLNPLLYRAADPLERWLSHRPRLWRRLTARVRTLTRATPQPADADPRFRAVVVGYGPVGRTLCRLLGENEIVPTVVEMNLDTVQRLRGEGVAAVYGDAGRRETLAEAGVATADTLVLSASGLSAAAEVVRLARELNPRVRVLARSAYLRERTALRAAGADVVFAGEGEVALAMAESVLRELGAGPDQIDGERERVRAELFGEDAGK